MSNELLKEALEGLKDIYRQTVACTVSRMFKIKGMSMDLITRIEAELAKPEREVERPSDDDLWDETLKERDEATDLIADVANWLGCDEEWSSAHSHFDCIRQHLKEPLLTPSTSRNVERMTAAEVDEFSIAYTRAFQERDGATCENLRVAFQKRIEAIQNAPFVPDWSNADQRWKGFVGFFTSDDDRIWDIKGNRSGFYISRPVPPPPTDAELSAMFDALPHEEKMAKLGVKA